jgi:HlyD family secretion protein
MNLRRLIVVLAVIALLGVAAYLWASGRPKPLIASGTVEAHNIRVGSKVGGRLDKVLVREGDSVEAGQVLVTFDDKELKANLDASRANLEKLEHGYRVEEVEQARDQAGQARADYLLKKRGYRQEDIDMARADLDRAQADALRAQRTWERASDLSNEGVFSRQQRDDAEGAYKSALGALHSAEQKLAETERGYRPEEIASAEHNYRYAATRALQYERGSRKEDIDQARAQFEYDEARYRECQVVTPTAAVVEVMDVRPGDLVAPNMPIVTLLERGQLYIRIYVPETKIGRVRIGQRAEVRLDAVLGQAFQGVVEQINQQAEFLPRNVQTPEERVHQMIGVKIRIQDREGKIRAGMAADVKLEGS